MCRGGKACLFYEMNQNSEREACERQRLPVRIYNSRRNTIATVRSGKSLLMSMLLKTYPVNEPILHVGAKYFFM